MVLERCGRIDPSDRSGGPEPGKPLPAMEHDGRGKCTPCRQGTPRLLAMLEELMTTVDPEGCGARIRELGSTIQLASLCGLGQAAPLALLRALDEFPEAFISARSGPGSG